MYYSLSFLLCCAAFCLQPSSESPYIDQRKRNSLSTSVAFGIRKTIGDRENLKTQSQPSLRLSSEELASSVAFGFSLSLATLLLASPTVTSGSVSMPMPQTLRTQTPFAVSEDGSRLQTHWLKLNSIEETFEAAIQILVAHDQSPDSVPAMFADLSEDLKPQLLGQVPFLLREVFNSDFHWLLFHGREVKNVTCMQPCAFDDITYAPGDHLLDLELCQGRRCASGDCSNACSRVVFQEFASEKENSEFLQEIDSSVPEDVSSQFDLGKCIQRDLRTALWYIRMVERLRRAIADEYGLRLASINLAKTSMDLRKAERHLVRELGIDEHSSGSLHYSGIIYLNTQGIDFEGGTLTFVDPSKDTIGDQTRSKFSPRSGLAVAFSSGWENMHLVEPVTAGRYAAIRVFFTTHSEQPSSHVSNADTDFSQRPWLPQSSEARDYSTIGQELLRLLQPSLNHDRDFAQLKAKWHYLFAM